MTEQIKLTLTEKALKKAIFTQISNRRSALGRKWAYFRIFYDNYNSLFIGHSTMLDEKDENKYIVFMASPTVHLKSMTDWDFVEFVHTTEGTDNWDEAFNAFALKLRELESQ